MFENVENTSSACPDTCISACSNAYIHARLHTSIHGCMHEMYECMTCIHAFIHASMLPCMMNAFINACMAACLHAYVPKGTNIFKMVISPRGGSQQTQTCKLGGAVAPWEICPYLQRKHSLLWDSKLWSVCVSWFHLKQFSLASYIIHKQEIGGNGRKWNKFACIFLCYIARWYLHTYGTIPLHAIRRTRLMTILYHSHPRFAFLIACESAIAPQALRKARLMTILYHSYPLLAFLIACGSAVYFLRSKKFARDLRNKDLRLKLLRFAKRKKLFVLLRTTYLRVPK